MDREKKKQTKKSSKRNTVNKTKIISLTIL